MDPTAQTPARPGPSSGGRDDCWSEGATETLISAWGDRYVSLNRGNLRQKDWQEVADAVNSRQNGTKPQKTDVQCKNRIDTLKKKYKIEKAKPPPSSWTFFSRLDSLIGSNPNAVTPSNAVKKVKLAIRKKSSGENVCSDSEEDEWGFGDERAVRKKQRVEEVAEGGRGAWRELARAVLRLGEVYERVESSKQERMAELEMERMEFAKEIEFERMNLFVDAQLEMERRARDEREMRRRGGGKRRQQSVSAKKL